MDSTQQEREKIYPDEKSRRSGSKSNTIEILIVAAAAVAGFAGFLMLIQKPNRKVKIEDLRRAYDGLSPEEE